MIETWLRAGVPFPQAVALAALHFRSPDRLRARSLDDAGWRELLKYCDRAGLTLFVAEQLKDVLPSWVAERTARNLARNRERVVELRELHGAAAKCLDDAGIPFLVLKGFTQQPLSGLPADYRAQYDIDVLTTPGEAASAAGALATLGFEPFTAMERFPTDHLPPLIRRTGWEFREDYFDPEIPVSIEVHFQLWDENFSRLPAPGMAAFWERRTVQEIGAHRVYALAPADALGYTSLHLLKHLLEGSVRPFHAYELARMLERNGGNDALWSSWRETHDPALRRLELLGFRLAERWFGCAIPEAVRPEWSALPDSVHTWFRDLALTSAAPANKSELWLYCALLASRRDRLAVVRRRLLPLHLPAPVDGVHLSENKLTWRRRLLRTARQARFITGRIAHHVTSALRLAGSGARWWWSVRTSGS
jgi:hypothetical protein